MFGVLTMHLTRLVNHGHAYEGAEDLFDLLSQYPLEHTFFHLFKPKRESIPFPSPLDNDAGLSNFHLVEFNRDTGEAKGKYHSDVGTEVLLSSDLSEGFKNRVNEEEESCGK